MDEQNKQDFQSNAYEKASNEVPVEDIQTAGVEKLQEFNYYEDDYEAPKLSAVQRMVKIFTNPSEVFEDILRKKSVYPPMIFALIVGLAVAFLQKDIYLQFIQTAPGVSNSMTPEQMKGYLNAMGIVFIVIMPVALLASMMVKSAAIKLLGTMQGTSGTYSQTLAVVAYAYVVQMLGVILQCIATLVTGVFGITFSPAILLPQDQMMTPLYTFLSTFSIFAIWYLIISIIGISIVHKISKGKAAVLVLVPFAISIAFSVVPMLMK